MAADLQVTPRYLKAPPIVDTWTGGYLGVSAGGRWTTENWTSSGQASHEFESSSARLGLYGGYNWQVQPGWIVGLEADVAWANNHASLASIPGTTGTGKTGTSEVKDLSDGGLRARVGYLVTPSTILFASGGVSWIQNQIDVSSVTSTRVAHYCAPDTISTSTASDSLSKTNMGWSLGGGIETKIAHNWLARGEYRYSSYGSQQASLMKGTQQISVDFDKHSTQTLLVGVAYQFGQ